MKTPVRIDYIKQAIPSVITTEGGAIATIVNKKTIPLKSSIEEARNNLCVIGNHILIEGNVMGLMNSMSEGIARDGNSRQIGDCLTIYPVVEGPIDLDTGWNPLVNKVKLRARLLGDNVLDTGNWSFNDVTPGKVSFTLTRVASEGDEGSVVKTGKAVHIEGKDIPTVDLLRIGWALEDGTKSGDVPASKMSGGGATKVQIAADAFPTFAEGDTGKAIIFTVRGCATKRTVEGTLVYVAPVGPTTITNIKSTSASGDFKYKIGEDVTITGTNLTLATGQTVGLQYDPPGGETVTLATQVKSATATEIVCDGTHGFNEVPEGLTAVVTVKGVTHDVVAE